MGEVESLSVNNLIMQNGDSIVGRGWYNELIIVPNPANDSTYYLFSIGVTSIFGLYYSIIDMRLNNGLGAVVSKNIQLQSFPMIDCLDAIKHANGRDWWIIFRQDPNFCFFQVRVKEATNEISYGYTASIDKAFCMSEEELTGQPYEYFGFHIEGAIENLVIKVTFPRHYKPDSVQSDVCIGDLVPTDVVYNSEVERIIVDGGFRDEWSGASITVRKPKMGYLYFLRWRPLPKVVVEGMKKRESNHR